MDNDPKEKAYDLLTQFKGDAYLKGVGCIGEIGRLCKGFQGKALLIANNPASDWKRTILAGIKKSLGEAGVGLVTEKVVVGARPNAPKEDVYRIEAEILRHRPDFLIAVGSGSTIDAVKAANVLAEYGDDANDVDALFGSNQVTALKEKAGRPTRPMAAVMLAAGSAAHLTKYSNITDTQTNQKKLIVDNEIIPRRALFDYALTRTAPATLTLDGAMDALAHSLEVYYGAQGDIARIEEVALTGISLVLEGLRLYRLDKTSLEAREALGLASDLGGYAIMIGGTSGAHLTSFSLVDILAHGRACAIMNPYYTVFFAPAIEEKLRKIAQLFSRAGFSEGNDVRARGRALGELVARAMMSLSASVQFPTTLGEVRGFSEGHMQRVLDAAKDPQLEMKLKNMPVPLVASQVDTYMRPILEAARTGDLALIKTM